MAKTTLYFWAIASSLLLAGCYKPADENSTDQVAAAPKQSNTTLDLKNSGFEASPTRILDWRVSQHAGEPAYEHVIDTTQATEGKHSYRITRTKKEAWGMVNQRLLLADSVGKTITLTAMLKGENLGTRGYEMALVFRKPNREFISEIKTTPITGSIDWQKVEVSGIVPEHTGRLQVSGVLMSEGTVWLDDIKVTISDTN